MRQKWDNAVKDEAPKPPLSGSSGLQGAWLRERRESSNYILPRIAVEICQFQRGPQGICMDPDCLPLLLRLSDQDIKHGPNSGLVHQSAHRGSITDESAKTIAWELSMHEGRE